MQRLHGYSLFIVTLLLIESACGQVQPASATVPVDRQSYMFRIQSPEIGQRIWQHVTMFANVTTKYAQQGQLISQTSRTLTREQVRRLTVVAKDSSGRTTVRLKYEKARKSLTQRGLSPELKDQPVLGKTYLVARPKDALVITYEDGSTPSKEEVDVVEKNMQAIGRTNPLAEFLNGKTLSIGQRLNLPPQLAKQLGWDGEYGEIGSVTLWLKSVKSIDGSPCGIFENEIEGKSTTGSMATKMRGDVTIEIATCRTLAADMRVQLNSEMERGPEGHSFRVSHRGQANLHTQARYFRE